MTVTTRMKTAIVVIRKIRPKMKRRVTTIWTLARRQTAKMTTWDSMIQRKMVTSTGTTAVKTTMRRSIRMTYFYPQMIPPPPSLVMSNLSSILLRQLEHCLDLRETRRMRLPSSISANKPAPGKSLYDAGSTDAMDASSQRAAIFAAT
jgi:hypothetical protein